MADSSKFQAILLFGMPGSGKGTQGATLGKIPGYLHVATGEVFRQLNQMGQLGRAVAQYTSTGKLVPDELTVQIFRNHLGLLQKHGSLRPDKHVLILDGIPRTFRQTELLDPVLNVLRIFYMKLRDIKEAVQRIKERAIKENRVDDADEAIIRDRLETFARDTADTLRYYDPSLVVEIDASQRPMCVLHDLCEHICRSPAENGRPG